MNTWTLTLEEYNDSEAAQHMTLITCDSRAKMVDSILIWNEIAYKCYVTEWNNESREGEIVEQVNALEWLEAELRECAPMPKTQRTDKKHSVKRVPIGNGEFYDCIFEYRGFQLHRNDSIPSGYGGRWRVSNFDARTRKECIDWINARIAQREAAN